MTLRRTKNRAATIFGNNVMKKKKKIHDREKNMLLQDALDHLIKIFMRTIRLKSFATQRSLVIFHDSNTYGRLIFFFLYNFVRLSIRLENR